MAARSAPQGAGTTGRNALPDAHTPIRTRLPDHCIAATDLRAGLALHLPDLAPEDPLREITQHLLGAWGLTVAASYSTDPDPPDAAVANARRAACTCFGTPEPALSTALFGPFSNDGIPA